MMWVSQGDNVIKHNLTIMNVIITWLAKKTNENFVKSMWALHGENFIQCIMKYANVGIACPKKCYVYF